RALGVDSARRSCDSSARSVPVRCLGSPPSPCTRPAINELHQPRRRARGLSRACPHPPRLLHLLPTDTLRPPPWTTQPLLPSKLHRAQAALRQPRAHRPTQRRRALGAERRGERRPMRPSFSFLKKEKTGDRRSAQAETNDEMGSLRSLTATV